MGLAKPVNASRTLRVFAALLSYPAAGIRAHHLEMRDILRSEAALTDARRTEIEALIGALVRREALEAEADYVELFDRGRGTSLHLFEHVHGDSRDRGPAMVDLAKTYEQAGLYLAEGELPDYLPAVLEFVSTQPPREAVAFLGETAHILAAIFSELQARKSAYASVLGALLDLAGEKAQAVARVAEQSLDESWEEPPVFGGCSSQGQAKPGQPQPIRIIRKNAHPGAAV